MTRTQANVLAGSRRGPRPRFGLIFVAAALTMASLSPAFGPAAGVLANPPEPNFGANVLIFNPTMPLSQIQAMVNGVADQQVNNQFGTQRYALLFEPGTYGSQSEPLIFQVGYYTSVAGLGLSPRDVVINGAVD